MIRIHSRLAGTVRFFATMKKDEELHSKLSAFASRTGLKLKEETLLDALTHTSYPKKSVFPDRYNLFGI
jgi:hypothetical protein